MKTIFTLASILVSLALIAPVATARVEEDPAQTIAEAYGIEHWDEIEELRFVFLVALPDGGEASRAWSWRPHENEVAYHGPRFDSGLPPTTYRREALDEAGRVRDPSLREIDRNFTNDSYWLLFPFYLVWSDPQVTDEGEAELPMRGARGGDGPASDRADVRKVIVQYPPDGGYTPGDVYELFVDPATHRLVQWNFRRGGEEEGRPATWEGHVSLGPLTVSTLHRGEEDFELRFVDVRAKLVGEDEWIEAELQQ